MDKPIWQSRTFWFNVVSLTVALVEILPPRYAVPIITVGNIVLRFLTTVPIR